MIKNNFERPAIENGGMAPHVIKSTLAASPLCKVSLLRLPALLLGFLTWRVTTKTRMKHKALHVSFRHSNDNTMYNKS
eukprot:4222150-Amphidinium_carterae.3